MMDPDAVHADFDRIRRDHRAAVDRLLGQLAEEDRAREMAGDPDPGVPDVDRFVPEPCSDDEPLRGRRWLRNSW
ncbi:hypothetical protein G4X40_02355 [Rhodococcus sp. D2-41]|uniref:Uncharacterized protein n=1 Tax=Speluncibacter jeojiensis TaxID=2710754 RepID=A0A9X4M584_9ACTN|nr:hypothetical protein [Rhodococcus sp. D2-41]MDG3008987.1 hypothetical protein [Rhodococcus sp. D2-41]MDG3015498.1 hypothetical protein [Corynebacteriales bacterium D3-21]